MAKGNEEQQKSDIHTPRPSIMGGTALGNQTINKLIYGLARWAYMCGNCHKAAFYLTDFPYKGTTVIVKSVLLLDFTHPIEGTMASCGNCGEAIGQFTLDAILPCSDL